MKRVAVVGGAGSGKTTLARRLAEQANLPHYDLDGLLLERMGEIHYQGRPSELLDRLTGDAGAIARFEEWIADGVYLWAVPLFERAERIIWLDTPWRVAGYRILTRHVKAELAGNNRFPGWRRLWRFWHHSRRFYSNHNEGGFNEFGTPRTHRDLAQFLDAYRHRLSVCRSRGDIESFIRDLFQTRGFTS